MYLPDPVSALRRAATRVRPGGLICLQEADLHYLWASPQTPLWTQVRAWCLEAVDKAGVEQRMGPSLYTAFRAAGLPGPRLVVETFAGGGPDAPAWGWANVVSGMIPLMERLGVTTRAEVDPATLPGRLLAETLACDGCVIGPPMTGAWAALPAAWARRSHRGRDPCKIDLAVGTITTANARQLTQPIDCHIIAANQLP
jgi:hypothetical protein